MPIAANIQKIQRQDAKLLGQHRHLGELLYRHAYLDQRSALIIDRENQVEILGTPVVFRCRRDVRAKNFATAGVTAQFHALVDINPGQRRQDVGRDTPVYEQCLQRVARAVALRLGIVGDADSLLAVSMLVDIDMAHAIEVFENGDARIVRNPFDEAFAAARHDNVDEFPHRNQLADGCTVGCFDDLDSLFRQPGRAQTLVHAGTDCLV